MAFVIIGDDVTPSMTTKSWRCFKSDRRAVESAPVKVNNAGEADELSVKRVTIGMVSALGL